MEAGSLQGNQYGNGSTAIILSDMDQTAWNAVPAVLVSKGYVVFTHAYRSLGTIADDMQAVIHWVQQHGAKKMVLIGSSAGGLAAIRAALSNKIDAVVALSPPLSYLNIAELTNDEAKMITIPKFIAFADQDSIIGAVSSAIYDMLPAPKEEKEYTGSEHGTELLDAHSDLLPNILRFLDTYGMKP